MFYELYCNGELVARFESAIECETYMETSDPLAIHQWDIVSEMPLDDWSGLAWD